MHWLIQSYYFPTVHHLMTIAISVLFPFILFSCSDIDGIKKKGDNKHKTDILFLFLVQDRSKGNCLRKDAYTGINYCDRRSSGICNANDLILTSGEKVFNLNEGNNLVKAVPACSFSFLNSGIVSETTTSFTEEDSIKSNNTYSIIESCEATMITPTATLLTESELLYANSPKGRIGISADKLYNTPDSVLILTLKTMDSVRQVKSDALVCLEGGFPQIEKDLISDLRTGKRTKALSSSTKAGTAKIDLSF